MDLDALYERDKGKRMVGFRVIVLPGKARMSGATLLGVPIGRLFVVGI